jgi:hypothetical protein
MSYTYNSGTNTVYQDIGTSDVNLSGLTGLAPVTTEIIGGKIRYILDASTSFICEGTMIIDPRENFLEMLKDGTDVLIISSTGILTAGLDVTYTYGSQVTNGLTIRMVGQSSQPWVSSIRNEGVFNWYGATIDSAGAIRTRPGGTMKIRDGYFVSRVTSGGVPQGSQIFFEGGTCDIIGLTKTIEDGLTFDNSSVGFVAETTVINLEGVSSTGNVSSDHRSTSLASIPYITISKYSPIENGICEPVTSLAYLEDCGGLYLKNPNLKRRTAYGDITRHGQLEAYKTCNGLVTYQGAPLEDVKLYWIDIDNGLRGVTTSTTWGKNYDEYKPYATSSAVNGTFTLSILEAAWYNTNPSAGTAVNSVVADRRLESGEVITVKAYKYGFNLTEIQFKGNNLGASDVVSPQSRNTSTVELSKATVDTYTIVTNSVDFKDLADSFLEDNWGLYLNYIVTRSGTTINLGTYDLDVDGQVVEVFSVTGNKITIKSSMFTGNLITTGVVTEKNGGSINGSVQDAGGLRDLSTINYTVNTSESGFYYALIDLSNATVNTTQSDKLDNVGFVLDSAGDYIWGYVSGSSKSIARRTQTGETSFAICVQKPGYSPIIDIGVTTSDRTLNATLIPYKDSAGQVLYVGNDTDSLITDISISLSLSVLEPPRIYVTDLLTPSVYGIFAQLVMTYTNPLGFLKLASGEVQSLLSRIVGLSDSLYIGEAQLYGEGSSSTLSGYISTSKAQLISPDSAFPVSIQKILGVDDEAAKLASFQGFIWINSETGTDSVETPYGTPLNPCKTLTNVKELSEKWGISSVKCRSPIVADTWCTGLKFYGDNVHSFDMNNQDFILCGFHYVRVKGIDSDTTTDDLFENCMIDANISCRAVFRNCMFDGVSTVVTLLGGPSDFLDCYSRVDGTNSITIDNVGNHLFNVRGWKGGLKLINMTSGDFSFGSSEGRLTVESSCGGTTNIVVRGNTRIVNNSVLVINTEDKSYVFIDGLETDSQANARYIEIKERTDRIPNEPAKEGTSKTILGLSV